MDDVNAACWGNVLDPGMRIVRRGRGSVDVSQIVALALAQAQWLGGALLVAGLAVRWIGKAFGRTLLVAGLLAAAALAYQEWQSLHNLLDAGGVLLLAAVLLGVLAWTVRGLSFVFAFVLIAAGFYLLLYGWTGPAFAGSTKGELAWAGATILTMIGTGLRGGALRQLPVAALGAGLQH